MTRVVINIFWPNFQDMWSIAGGTSPPSFITFWGSLNVRQIFAHSARSGPFQNGRKLGHKLIAIIDQQKQVKLIST